jgi:hypothetical protein
MIPRVNHYCFVRMFLKIHFFIFLVKQICEFLFPNFFFNDFLFSRLLLLALRLIALRRHTTRSTTSPLMN